MPQFYPEDLLRHVHPHELLSPTQASRPTFASLFYLQWDGSKHSEKSSILASSARFRAACGPVDYSHICPQIQKMAFPGLQTEGEHFRDAAAGSPWVTLLLICQGNTPGLVITAWFTLVNLRPCKAIGKHGQKVPEARGKETERPWSLLNQRTEPGL